MIFSYLNNARGNEIYITVRVHSRGIPFNLLRDIVYLVNAFRLEMYNVRIITEKVDSQFFPVNSVKETVVL